MERMEEYVVDADDQSLQYMLTEASWDDRAVMAQVARDVDRVLGGSDESCLLIDETSFAKKGKYSVGVARQWCGRMGKIDNCQVGVFAALGRGHRSSIVDYRLYLPESWADDEKRCKKAGIPQAERIFKTKSEQALEMVVRQRQQGIRFSWVGADGGYGKEPAFLRGLDDLQETFVVDVHKDQRVYLEDPKPVIESKEPASRGRKRTRYTSQSRAIRVDQWAAEQPTEAWKSHTLRDATQGELRVQILHQRIWLWDHKESQARHWHLIVRRELGSPTTLKYTLSNASETTMPHQLAKMQGQRFWIEQSFRDGKSEAGMADYQARKWSAWHHHMALVSMAMLFMLEQREKHQDDYPLLSCNDIEQLLRAFLPRRDIEHEEVLRQMHERHRRRQSAIDSAFKKQRESRRGDSVTNLTK